MEVPKPEPQQQVESKAHITRCSSPQLQRSQHPHQNVPSVRHNHCWHSNHNAPYPKFPQVRLALLILGGSRERCKEGCARTSICPEWYLSLCCSLSDMQDHRLRPALGLSDTKQLNFPLSFFFRKIDGFYGNCQ